MPQSALLRCCERRCGEWQNQRTRPRRVMEYFDAGYACLGDLFVSDATAGVVVLLIVRRVERRDREPQTRAGRDAPRHPPEVEWNLDDLLRL